MKQVFIYLLVFSSQFGFCLNLEFYSAEARFEVNKEEYQYIWNTQNSKVLEKFKKETGIEFRESINNETIRVKVYEGPSFSGTRGKTDMRMRATYTPETKKATLIHELGHRLLAPYKFPKKAKKAEVDSHKILFLILYDVWEDLYGEEFADKQVEVEKKRKGLYDYEEAWDWALSYSRDQRKQLFKSFLRQ